MPRPPDLAEILPVADVHAEALRMCRGPALRLGIPLANLTECYLAGEWLKRRLLAVGTAAAVASDQCFAAGQLAADLMLSGLPDPWWAHEVVRRLNAEGRPLTPGPLLSRALAGSSALHPYDPAAEETLYRAFRHHLDFAPSST